MKPLLQTLLLAAFTTPALAQNPPSTNPQSPQAASPQSVEPNPKCKEILNEIAAMSKLTSSPTVYDWENPDWVQGFLGPAKVITSGTQTNYLWMCPGTDKTWIQLYYVKGNLLGIPFTGAAGANCNAQGCQTFEFERTGSDIKGNQRTISVSPNSNP